MSDMHAHRCRTFRYWRLTRDQGGFIGLNPLTTIGTEHILNEPNTRFALGDLVIVTSKPKPIYMSGIDLSNATTCTHALHVLGSPVVAFTFRYIHEAKGELVFAGKGRTCK